MADVPVPGAFAPRPKWRIQRIVHHGVEMRLVIKGTRTPAPRADLALLKAVARAHQWSDDLLSGRVRSIEEIAARERVSGALREAIDAVGFPAPKIVEMIAAGSQPPDLTAEALAERIDLPLLWTEQERVVLVS
jgi:site-specific DNA recombinase